MTVRCIDCGHEQPDGETHCKRCGHRFDGGYDGAFEDWRPDASPDDDFYVTYELFGVEYRIRKWSWDLGIVMIVGVCVAMALIYAVVGWWTNAVIILLTGCLAGSLLHRIGKTGSGAAGVVLVVFLLMFGVFLAMLPWHTQ
jgi:hypothetical protein